MARDFTFTSFVDDLKTRIGATVVVVGIFFGLGYIKGTDLVGLSSVLDSQFAFFSAVFLLVTFVGSSWILYEQSKM